MNNGHGETVLTYYVGKKVDRIVDSVIKIVVVDNMKFIVNRVVPEGCTVVRVERFMDMPPLMQFSTGDVVEVLDYEEVENTTLEVTGLTIKSLSTTI